MKFGKEDKTGKAIQVGQTIYEGGHLFMNYLLFIYNYLLFINVYADGQAGRRGISVRCQYNNVNLDFREVT